MALGAEPGEIPLNVKLLRRRLDEVAPESLGLSRLGWNNVRALLNRAVELKAKVMPSAQQSTVSPAWQALADHLPRSKWFRLGALLRHDAVDVGLVDIDFDFETLATRVYSFAAIEAFEEAAFGALTIVLIGLVPVILLNWTIVGGRRTPNREGPRPAEALAT